MASESVVQTKFFLGARFRLRSEPHQKWVVIKPPGNEFVVTERVADFWWESVPLGGGVIALRRVDGLRLATALSNFFTAFSAGRANVGATNVNDGEEWLVVERPNNAFAFRSRYERYLTAESNGRCEPSQSTLGPDQTFEVLFDPTQRRPLPPPRAQLSAQQPTLLRTASGRTHAHNVELETYHKAKAPMVRAAETGDVATLARHLASGASANLPGPNTCTLVGIAAANARTQACRLLLDNGALPNFRDADGNTALHHAVRAGDAEIVAMLTKAGALPTIANLARETPLDWSASNTQIHTFLRSFAQRLVEEQRGLDRPETPPRPQPPPRPQHAGTATMAVTAAAAASTPTPTPTPTPAPDASADATADATTATDAGAGTGAGAEHNDNAPRVLPRNIVVSTQQPLVFWGAELQHGVPRALTSMLDHLVALARTAAKERAAANRSTVDGDEVDDDADLATAAGREKTGGGGGGGGTTRQPARSRRNDVRKREDSVVVGGVSVSVSRSGDSDTSDDDNDDNDDDDDDNDDDDERNDAFDGDDDSYDDFEDAIDDTADGDDDDELYTVARYSKRSTELDLLFRHDAPLVAVQRAIAAARRDDAIDWETVAPELSSKEKQRLLFSALKHYLIDLPTPVVREPLFLWFDSINARHHGAGGERGVGRAQLLRFLAEMHPHHRELLRQLCTFFAQLLEMTHTINAYALATLFGPLIFRRRSHLSAPVDVAGYAPSNLALLISEHARLFAAVDSGGAGSGDARPLLIPVNTFRKVWDDRGGNVDEKYPLSAFTPHTDPKATGFYSIGAYFEASHFFDLPVRGAVAYAIKDTLLADGTPALAPAEDFQKVWEDRWSRPQRHYGEMAVWRALPPRGYVALGVAVSSSYSSKPHADSFRCVHQSLVLAGAPRVYSRKVHTPWLWSTRAVSAAEMQMKLWAVDRHPDIDLGVRAATFMCVPQSNDDHTPPDFKLFAVLNSSKFAQPWRDMSWSCRNVIENPPAMVSAETSEVERRFKLNTLVRLRSAAHGTCLREDNRQVSARAGDYFWSVVPIAEDTIALRTPWRLIEGVRAQHHLTVRKGVLGFAGAVEATASEAKNWEEFRVHARDGGTWLFQTLWGTYLAISADGSVVANSREITNDTLFLVDFRTE